MKSRRITPGPPSRGWTLALASRATFVTALDTLVVTTALPVLRVDLHASMSALEWTVNAYNLAFACLLLTGAALGDRFGRRRMFIAGMAAFTAVSAASALSPDVHALILAWAVQGASAAIVTGAAGRLALGSASAARIRTRSGNAPGAAAQEPEGHVVRTCRFRGMDPQNA